MRPVSDSFFLTVAEASAGLIGLFLVGMIFYIQTGYDRNQRSRQVVEPYFRAATLITLIAYAIPLGVSLTLVLSLIMANVGTVSTVRAVTRVTKLRLLAITEVVGTAVVALMVILPLATGGLRPDREDLAPAILLSLGVAFLGTIVLVLTLFDVARFERSELPEPRLRRALDKLRSRDDHGPAHDIDTAQEPSSQNTEEKSS